VGTDAKGTLLVHFTLSAGGVSGAQYGDLSVFLPEGDPNRTKGADDLGRGLLSEALRQRGLTWLQEQATARLGKKVKP
jgi:hypothetical protein